ncbi:MAG: TetR/AcrR family transcriptional regulator [Gammaproteobacteria bacterium]|jgi:AcrR family transcriptional regulator
MSKPAKKRKNYHHGNLYNELLFEAAQTIKKDGLAKLSLRKLAKKCGVSVTASYRHFADKNALVVAVIQRGYELLYKHLNAILDKKANHNIIPRLKSLGYGYIEFAQQHQNFFYIMYGNHLLPKDYTQELKNISDKVHNLLAALIKEGIKNKILKKDNSDYVTFSMWAYLHGITLLILQGKANKIITKSNTKKFINHLMQFLQTGIGQKH